ncbi:MAG: HAMP domain-containing histidine kinase, partial [Cyclobacteriaceae bacterium]|nr:HAMP domain-containing histidine kinase [Cyclobacteriaceae bacterium]
DLIFQLHENESLQLSINQVLEQQVNERTREVQSQNEELFAQQKELLTHRDTLEERNRIIAQSMKELESVKSQLEVIVEERTHQLQKANLELIQHNNHLEQYAFITAQNLRAPVARLKGLMYILEKTSGVNEQNNQVVKKIVNSAHEMDEVLSDMNSILELKNKDIGQSYEVDIEVIIGKVKKILYDNLQESKAEIVLNLDVQNIHANEPYLESVIYNLVSNSIKYRSNKRTLRINISTYKDNSKVVLKISDNGVGIDLSKFEEKLFGLYQRFHDHVVGKGLGLYLVKTQVEALGGNIEIDSEVDKGTTFKISFSVENEFYFAFSYPL